MPRVAPDRNGLVCLFLASLLFATTVYAQEPRRYDLPHPRGRGGHAGFLGPTARPDDLAAHLRGTLRLSALPVPEGPSPLVLGYDLGLSASFWHWAEAGATVEGRVLLDSRAHAAGPITLWMRAGPPAIGGWLSLSGLVEHASATPPFDGAGELWPSTTTLGIIAGLHKGPVALTLDGGYLRASDSKERRYDGLQAHAGAWFRFAHDGAWAFHVGGEAVGRIGGEQGQAIGQERSLDFVVGLRLVDELGMGFGLGYGQGWGPGADKGTGYIRMGYSVGRPYKKPDPEPYGPDVDQLAGMVMWFAGYRDPIIGADGNIWSDDGKTMLGRFGVPDPYHAGQIVPFRGDRPVAAGQAVLLRSSDGAVRTFTGQLLGYSIGTDFPSAIDRAMAAHKHAQEARHEEDRRALLPSYAAYRLADTGLVWSDLASGAALSAVQGLNTFPAPIWSAAGVRRVRFTRDQIRGTTTAAAPPSRPTPTAQAPTAQRPPAPAAPPQPPRVGSYIPPPKTLAGIPEAQVAKYKTPVQGGGGLRKRWKDPAGNIYEWDSRHGAVEKYDKRGRHQGEYDPATGKQVKPADPTRRIDP